MGGMPRFGEEDGKEEKQRRLRLTHDSRLTTHRLTDSLTSVYGKRCDELVYGITAEEFAAGPASALLDNAAGQD